MKVYVILLIAIAIPNFTARADTQTSKCNVANSSDNGTPSCYTFWDNLDNINYSGSYEYDDEDPYKCADQKTWFVQFPQDNENSSLDTENVNTNITQMKQNTPVIPQYAGQNKAPDWLSERVNRFLSDIISNHEFQIISSINIKNSPENLFPKDNPLVGNFSVLVSKMEDFERYLLSIPKDKKDISEQIFAAYLLEKINTKSNHKIFIVPLILYVFQQLKTLNAAELKIALVAFKQEDLEQKFTWLDNLKKNHKWPEDLFKLLQFINQAVWNLYTAFRGIYNILKKEKCLRNEELLYETFENMLKVNKFNSHPSEKKIWEATAKNMIKWFLHCINQFEAHKEICIEIELYELGF
ncbi:hypothetical protein FACS1894113_0570 [Alphaproteobacteria bacterium]|nr:hypothetical protein FACS1894113_0570 [Alphaproteobacteria bacterium]